MTTCEFQVEAVDHAGTLSVCVYDTLPAATAEAGRLAATGWREVRVFRVVTVTTRREIA